MNRSFLIDKLEEKILKAPTKIAIKYKDTTLTYSELGDKINRIKNLILSKTKGKNKIIPVRIEDNLSAFITILAIIKSNCAYLPIPKEIKKEKTSDILSEIEKTFIITDLDEDYNEWEVLNFNSFDKMNKEITVKNKIKYIDNNTFCVIYTSGTTGKPKGCILSDKNICQKLNVLSKLFPILEGENSFFLTNYSFDVSITEIFGWILGKGDLVIHSGDKGVHLAKLLSKNNITHLAISPSHLGLYLEKSNLKYFEKIKYLFLAGEVFPLKLAKFINKYLPNIKTYNLYGPTEASIYATVFNIKELNNDNPSVPIGKPLDETKIKILKGGNITEKEEEIGEILIGGEGVAQGYYKRKELTKEKFIIINNNKYYKTGDLGYVLKNKIYYCGRIDKQLKINGIRVETEEIENKIEKVFNLNKVIVLQHEYKEKKYLVAYLNDFKMEEKLKSLKKKLEERLEKYFIPNIYINLKEIPLNKNMKVDFITLESIFKKYLEDKNLNKNELASGIEEKVQKIWKAILKTNIKNNIDFNDAGGDSLDMVLLNLRLNETFNLELSNDELLVNNTILGHTSIIAKKIAKLNSKKYKELKLEGEISKYDTKNNEEVIYLKESKRKKVVELLKKSSIFPDRILSLDKKIKEETLDFQLKIPLRSVNDQEIESYPLFSRQEFYIRQNFNQYLTKKIEIEEQNINKIIDTINCLIKTQLLFKSVIANNKFKLNKFKPLEEKDINIFNFSEISYNNCSKKIKELEELAIEKFQKINIEDNYLYEILIIKKSLNKYQIIFVINHHIADGFSLNNLERLFIKTHYNEKEKEEKSFTYKDFTEDVIDKNDENTIKILKNSLFYKELKESINSIESDLKISKDSELKEIVVSYPMKGKLEQENYLFDQISNIIKLSKKIDNQAFQILKNINTFNSKDYKNQIGDFHVSIFLPFKNSEENNLYSKSEELLKEIYLDKNIHIDYLCSSNRFLNNEDMKLFQKVPFSINYLGQLNDQELELWQTNAKKLSDVLKGLHSKKIRITCFNNKDKGYIYFLNGLNINKESILKEIRAKINEI